MIETKSGITQVANVMAPVADQDAAIEWYTQVLGFEKRFDSLFGDGDRWVEVGPAGGETAIALVVPRESGPAAATFGVFTEDVEAEHARLREAGVAEADLMRMPPPVPPMFHIQDPDGNNIWIVGRA